jgi:hypothetical protein
VNLGFFFVRKVRGRVARTISNLVSLGLNNTPFGRTTAKECQVRTFQYPEDKDQPVSARRMAVFRVGNVDLRVGLQVLKSVPR